MPADADADAAEHDLELLGLLGLEPAARRGGEAIAACRRAGIRVAMVTGDHPATAPAIAAEVGLLDADGSPVVDGTDLPGRRGRARRAARPRRGRGRRVTPEDKLRIARALQARGSRRGDDR